MTLSIRPRPKVQHKKRKAEHHKRGKHYLKAYHPYLPMLIVIGLGIASSQVWTLADQTTPSQVNPQQLVALGRPPTRIEILAGNNSQTGLLVVIVLAVLASLVLIGLHSQRLRKVLFEGEAYVIKHPWLETTLVFVCTFSCVLTRSALFN